MTKAATPCKDRPSRADDPQPVRQLAVNLDLDHLS